MDRENQKAEYYKKFRYGWISQKVREYNNYSTTSLEEKIKQLLLDGKNTPAYLILFFLNTSLYTKTYKYMLYASSESLYMDQPLGIQYWEPEFMKKDAASIREALMGSKGRRLGLREDEVEEGIRFVLRGYEDIITVLWKRAVKKVIGDDKELLILAGEYMGELKK